MFENVYYRDIKQVFRETVEIKKILFKNLALNRDTGEFGSNSIYEKLLDKLYSSQCFWLLFAWLSHTQIHSKTTLATHDVWNQEGNDIINEK